MCICTILFPKYLFLAIIRKYKKGINTPAKFFSKLTRLLIVIIHKFLVKKTYKVAKLGLDM